MKPPALSFRLIFVAWLAAVASSSISYAEPGDTHTAFSSRAPDMFPGYSNVLGFADYVSGDSTALGTYHVAFRFASEASGPLQKITVVLYGYAPSGTEASAQIVLYADAGGDLGLPIRTFQIPSVSVGVFTGYILYNTDPSLVLKKGMHYWVGVEPLHNDSQVAWAQGTGGPKCRRAITNVNGLGYDDVMSISDFVIVDCEEPIPPQVLNPGVPLVEDEQVPGEDQGTTLDTLGVTVQAPLLGKIKAGHSTTAAILGADGSVQLRAGDAAPSLAGTVIAKLGEPCGDAVLAALKHQSGSPAVTAANDVVLIAGLKSGTLRVAARTGDSPTEAGTATLKSIGSFDGNGADIFFLAKLTGPGTSKSTDGALCSALAGGGVRLLAREGQSVNGKTISTIATLVGSAGTLAEGRWRVDDHTIGARMTFAPDKSQAIYTIPSNAVDPSRWVLWANTGVTLTGDLDGASFVSFGLPGFGPDVVAYTATLKPAPGSVTKANDAVLLKQTMSATTLLGREGSPAVDASGTATPDLKYKSFSDPICGAGGKVAFAAKVKAAKGADGIWWVDGADTLRLIARTGDNAPGAGSFVKFASLVLPDGATSGPIIQGKLAPNPLAGVTPQDTQGLWGVDVNGVLGLMARNGGYVYLNDDVYGNIKSFTALLGAAGSPGAAHGVDADGSVRINAVIQNLASSGTTRAQFPIPVATN